MDNNLHTENKTFRIARRPTLVADKTKGEYLDYEQVGRFVMGYTGCEALRVRLMRENMVLGEDYILKECEADYKVESHLVGFDTIFDKEAIIRLSDLNDLPLVKGLNVIVGGHGAGKTPFMRDTIYPAVEHEKSDYFMFGEPWIGYETLGSRLCANVLQSLIAGNKVILIDSLKNVMDRTGGPLAKEGINRPFFSMLSDWSAIAMQRNCAIVVVFNLLADSAAVLAETLNRLNSSTNMVILAEGSGNFSYKVRDHDNSERISGSFTSDGVKFSHNGGKRAKPLTEAEYRSKMKIVQEALLEQQFLTSTGD